MTRIFKDIFGNTACITRRLGFPCRDAKNKIYGYKLTLSADYNGGDVYFVTIYPSEEDALRQLRKFSCNTWQEQTKRQFQTIKRKAVNIMNTDKLEQYLDELSDGTDFSFGISEATDETIELYMQGDNPCCEDWCIEFTIDNPTTKKELIEILADEILELYEGFDIEEETYVMLEAKRNGVSGVPDVVALVHNEEYKENALKEFAEKLRNLYNNLDKEETDTMNKEQFFEYIHENFNIDGASQSLILNILDYIEANYSEKNEQYNALCSLLDGTIGLEDRELKKVYM